MGKTDAGKSTLVNTILGEKVAEVGMGGRQTEKNELYSRKFGNIEINVYDTVGLEINEDTVEVTVDDKPVKLTPIEYKMMTLLVNNSGKVLTHHYIQNQVWGYDTTDDYQSLRVFMANIRRKIEDDTANPRFILTEVGVGYRFADE